MKRIYLDFETTSTNPLKAEILQATFYLVDDHNPDSPIFVDANIYVPKEYNDFSEEEKETLKFNGINNEEQYNIRNKYSNMGLVAYFDEVIKAIKEMYNGVKIPLSGWNNAGFDNIIFRRKLEELKGWNPEYSTFFDKYIDYHTRDIMHGARLLKDLGLLKGTNLFLTHRDLIGTRKEEEFHSSIIDCQATKEIDDFILKNFDGRFSK